MLGVAFFSGCNLVSDSDSSLNQSIDPRVSTAPTDTALVSPEAITPEPIPPLLVEASFYPLAFFAEQIAGDLAVVNNLSGGTSPHSYTLSPRDRVRLAEADIFLYQGLGLEAWAEEVAQDISKKGGVVKEASEGIMLQKNKLEENHEEHSDEKESHEDEDLHDHGEFDPHTWLDPVLAQQMVQGISEVFQSKDPQNAEVYIQNTNILLAELAKLDEEYKMALRVCSRDETIISHDAFGYLESRYGFNLHPIAGLSPSDEPSAKILAELKHLMEEEGITHILSEVNTLEKYSQTLSSETGLSILYINPLGTTPQQGSYFDVSRSNIASLSEALGCQ